MKTFIHRSIILLALSLIMGSTFSADPIRHNDSSMKRSTLERNLDRALNRHLSFPLAAQGDMIGEVYVSFVIDKDGDLQVLDCRSANAELREHVLTKLARINVGQNPEGIWKTTHMHIRFRPERPAT